MELPRQLLVGQGVAGAAAVDLDAGVSRFDLTARDVFGAPLAADAQLQLKHCEERLAEYTDRVFTALHQF